MVALQSPAAAAVLLSPLLLLPHGSLAAPAPLERRLNVLSYGAPPDLFLLSPPHPRPPPLHLVGLRAGAAGDGASDDAPAIQKALDDAQQGKGLADCPANNQACPGSAVYFPAGTYLVNTTLTIASTHTNASNERLARSVRLVGDGMRQSTVRAGASGMDAVLRFLGSDPKGSVPGVTTNENSIENMEFDASGLANYSVAAVAITRSQMRYTKFSGARVAGLVMGYGCEPNAR